jgi:hypothetical protein
MIENKETLLVIKTDGVKAKSMIDKEMEVELKDILK